MLISTDVMCNQACHGWATGTFELSVCAGLSQRPLIFALSNAPDQVSSKYVSTVMLLHAIVSTTCVSVALLLPVYLIFTVSEDNGG